MTTEQAREIADGYAERCLHMGENNGETGRLGQCVSVIRDLAGQLDNVEGLKARVVELGEKARQGAEAAEAARLAAEADNTEPTETTADTAPPTPEVQNESASLGWMDRA